MRGITLRWVRFAGGLGFRQTDYQPPEGVICPWSFRNSQFWEFKSHQAGKAQIESISTYPQLLQAICLMLLHIPMLRCLNALRPCLTLRWRCPTSCISQCHTQPHTTPQTSNTMPAMKRYCKVLRVLLVLVDLPQTSSGYPGHCSGSPTTHLLTRSVDWPTCLAARQLQGMYPPARETCGEGGCLIRVFCSNCASRGWDFWPCHIALKATWVKGHNAVPGYHKIVHLVCAVELFEFLAMICAMRISQ